MRKTSLPLAACCAFSWAVAALAGEPARAPSGSVVTAPSGAAGAEAAGGAEAAAGAEGPAPEGAAESTSAPPASAAAPTAAATRPEPPVKPAASPPEEDTPRPPPARDTVGGHLVVGAIVGLAVPFGSIDSTLSQADVIGTGLFLGGDITYGVSRTVMLGAYGEVGMPSAQGVATGETVSVIAAGPLVRYHLAQGLRFDPWLAYGIGFRRLGYGPDSVTGLDWARLQLGGDWYAASALGFGPVLELSMGTFLASSKGSLDTKSVNAQFVLGGRIVFDGPGK